jgi:hypothetical protein
MLFGGQIEAAVLDTLRTWAPVYVAEVERQAFDAGLFPALADGRHLPAIRSWAVVGDRTLAGAGAPPRVLIIARGLAGEPARDGTGAYRAAFAVAFMVVAPGNARVDTNGQQSANRNARLYCAALRTALLQQRLPTLPGFAGLEWVDERYDELPPDGGDSLAAASAAFRVHVDDVANTARPFGVTPPDPFTLAPDAPTVREGGAGVDVDKTDELS